MAAIVSQIRVYNAFFYIVDADPSAGAGTPGAIGSFAEVADGSVYEKTGAADTDWTLRASPAGAAIPGSNARFIYKSALGVVESLESMAVDAVSGGFAQSLTQSPNNVPGNYNINFLNENIDPIQNSPDESYNVLNLSITFDTLNQGFSVGTAGTAARFLSQNLNHQGLSNIGDVQFITNNFSLGNGVDPFTVRGIGYAFGFGQVNSGITVSDFIQGYGFQPSLQAGAILSLGCLSQAFYDNLNSAIVMYGHTSFVSNPVIAEVANNYHVTGLNINPNIPLFTGNAGYTGVGVNGIYGVFDSGSWTGINVNPTISDIKYAAGINVSMDNVTTFVGSPAFVVIQDITITASQNGVSGDGITFEYVNDVVAGAEFLSGSFPAFEIHIESGVSTATQVKTAFDAYGPLIGNATCAITGVASNPQVTQGPTPTAGGVDDGVKRAAFLDGDVEITGSLTFGGALSIGQLNAFYSQAMASGTGNPITLNGLVSQLIAGDGLTLTNVDVLGLNTACLIGVGTGTTVTSTFLGITALGLPAVVQIGAGSTVERIAGATFAISMGGGGAGATITNLDLCRAIAIPDGVTSVTRLAGYKMDLPFGDPGVTTWGVYITPTVNNYMAGNLVVGGTAGTDDTPSNANVGIELKSTTKAIRFSNMDTTERDAMTALSGMVIFNTTTSKLQVYDGTTWVDLH